MTTQVLTQTIIISPKVNLRKLWVFGFIFITSLLIFYIFQISAITKDSFFIAKYEQGIASLSQQNKILEKSILQENSLANLEAILKNYNYEKINKVYYLRVMDGQMVVKP